MEQSNNHDNSNSEERGRPAKRRRLRHKVVIHTSPFLRCLQTSIAIAAGMAQYNPSIELSNEQKRPNSASPRMRSAEGSGGSPRSLSAIPGPKHDLVHAVARKALHEHKRYRKAKLRVDAFLGEWLNKQYYEGITAPPPSPMMLATAKAELLENESVQIFRPTIVTKNSTDSNSLWGGGNASGGSSGRLSPLDDWSPVEDAIPPSPPRSRANSQNSPIGMESGRRSPFRPGSPLLPLASLVPKQEPSIYRPPTPQYAVSASHLIPRGYVVHARNACTNVDYSWDSSRPPQSWGDGGEFGEEWSHMHKRIRKGLTSLVEWYSHGGGVNEEADDAIEFEKLDGQTGEDERQEDLVVILVTHGAGCNALMGALTGQPVLLDVGMASLTMAVRKHDAPQTNATAPNLQRRGSVDTGLSTIYEMKMVASTEHLRPGAELKRAASPAGRSEITTRDVLPRFQERLTARSNTNSSLGTIRRPSAVSIPSAAKLNNSGKGGESDGNRSQSQPMTLGLWTPPASRSPGLQPQTAVQEQKRASVDSGESVKLDNSNSAPTSQPRSPPPNESDNTSAARQSHNNIASYDGASDDSNDGSPTAGMKESDDVLSNIPPELSRRLSQQGLWGSRPSGAHVERRVRQPKRRWTVEQD